MPDKETILIVGVILLSFAASAFGHFTSVSGQQGKDHKQHHETAY